MPSLTASSGSYGLVTPVQGDNDHVDVNSSRLRSNGKPPGDPDGTMASKRELATDNRVVFVLFVLVGAVYTLSTFFSAIKTTRDQVTPPVEHAKAANTAEEMVDCQLSPTDSEYVDAREFPLDDDDEVEEEEGDDGDALRSNASPTRYKSAFSSAEASDYSHEDDVAEATLDGGDEDDRSNGLTQRRIYEQRMAEIEADDTHLDAVRTDLRTGLTYMTLLEQYLFRTRSSARRKDAV